MGFLQRASRAIKQKRNRLAPASAGQPPIEPQVPSSGRRREPKVRGPAFRSSSFVIFRLIQIFIALAILGGIIRLSFFDYLQGDGDTGVLTIPLRLTNKFAYYLYLAVSGASTFLLTFTLVLYLINRLPARPVMIVDGFLILLWFASGIVWAIAVRSYYNIVIKTDNDYYVRSAHLGMQGLTILIFFLLIPTFFVGLRERKSAVNYNALPEQFTLQPTTYGPTAMYDYPPAGAPPVYNPPAGPPPHPYPQPYQTNDSNTNPFTDDAGKGVYQGGPPPPMYMQGQYR